MRLIDLFESAAPSGVITAYHGGSGFDGHFNLNFSGSGEGYRILGPGMYFITNKYMANTYGKKYGQRDNSVYTVELNVRNFYNNRAVPSDAVVAAFEGIAKELGLASAEEITYYPQNALRSGRGRIGKVVEMAGHKKAQELFIKHGLDGAMENIDDDIWELCVFNLDMVRIINKEPVTE